MTGDTALVLGDFTALAEKYALYRPGYSSFVLDALVGLSGRVPESLKVADVGAGTGIWSRMMAQRGLQVTAVEPNDAMRAEGMRQNGRLPVVWVKGSGEASTLADRDFDIVTMASAFHWTDFDAAYSTRAWIARRAG